MTTRICLVQKYQWDVNRRLSLPSRHNLPHLIGYAALPFSNRLRCHTPRFHLHTPRLGVQHVQMSNRKKSLSIDSNTCEARHTYTPFISQYFIIHRFLSVLAHTLTNGSPRRVRRASAFRAALPVRRKTLAESKLTKLDKFQGTKDIE